MTASCSC